MTHEQHLEAKVEQLRAALEALVEAFRNPGDDDVFEEGEVPELDAARTLLSTLKLEVRPQ